MTHKLFLCGLAIHVALANSWSNKLPQYAEKNDLAPSATASKVHKKSSRSQQSVHARFHAHASELRRALQLSNHSANTQTILHQRKQQQSRYLLPYHDSPTTAASTDIDKASWPLPGVELKTLARLYDSLGGSKWHIKDGWMSESNPCGNGSTGDNWFGVKCSTHVVAPWDNSSSHVTGLEMPQNNLVGKLPPLVGLSHLLHLDFSNPSMPGVSTGITNAVRGTLDALCGLGNISTVLLANNNVTGSIPRCIQSLTNVTVLNLDHNAIFGTTPDDLCQLCDLEELHLRGNYLQGTIPECIGEALTALRVLDYSNLDADSNIGNQSLSGTLPLSLCDLGYLETMSFQMTQGLSGKVPECIGSRQTQLRVLSLENNLFHGTIPPKICQASALEHLVLYGNNLTGNIPSCLGSLSQLSILELCKNHFHGTLPEELCEASALNYLVLYENDLTGTLPSCLGTLSQLTVLELDINHFYGTLPEELCQASALEYLLLYNNNLTGTLPSCLGKLGQIKMLDLNSNHFHSTLPPTICEASSLTFLALWNNSLTGTLPNCLGNLSNILDLILSINQFQGTLPEELCQVSLLEVLVLYENDLTGILPSCLGSLAHLKQLELHSNDFQGTLPEELCEATALELLWLNENILTGTLPSCLAKSLPSLEALLLHDNDLSGAIPLEWALPSLVSILLSNNPKVSGTIPSSLFLQPSAQNISQSSWEPNTVLRAVVIEGTSIEGTLPAVLCSAPQLRTLAFSGNRLTGPLPNCIGRLRNLQTLRIANNHLNGTLSEAINNMSSLTELDLSTNELQGRVPAALGDISHNLNTMNLQLNRLSCDLPVSVLDWQVSSAQVSFNLLDGNLFGCGANTDSASYVLSIQGASGLRKANEHAFDAYSCGNSNYLLPLFTIAVLAVPVVVGLMVMFCRSRLALEWHATFKSMMNPSKLMSELYHADRQLRILALGVMAASTLSGSVALVLSLRVARSTFECEFMAAPTLANKHDGDVQMLSVGVGGALCVGLILGLATWWHRILTEYGSHNNDCDGAIVENKLLDPLEEVTDAWDFDAENMAETISQKSTLSYFDRIARALKLVALLLALVVFTVGPNIGYVLVVLSELNQQQKVASEVAVTLAKTAIGTLVVPKMAQTAVDLLVLNSALTFIRFRLRLAIATALSATTMILLPATIVLVTDKRCLYYIFKPQPAVDTDVPISYRSLTTGTTGQCNQYASFLATSTYVPSFAYDGEICISAILSVYGPVFLGAVLLAATLPAGLEMGIVPWLAPWCYENAKSSRVARASLALLQAVTWNIWPTLMDANVLPPEFSLSPTKLDYLAQRVVERAFLQVMSTLMLALTFGIAVPAVGGACAVAAFVHLVHHRHVLGQIVALGRIEQPRLIPNLRGCIDVPVGCAVVVVLTVLLVWVFGSMDYLEPATIAVMIFIGLSMTLAISNGVAWWRSSRVKGSRRQDRTESAASSNLSKGMLIDSLIDEGGDLKSESS